MDKMNKYVALVTGATGGLGTAMCRKLQDDGYRVIGNYMNEEKAQSWKQKQKQDGYEFEIFQCDVSDYDSVGKMIASIENEIGSIDILVNNAGINQKKEFTEVSDEEIQNIITTNVTAVFTMSREVVKHMLI